MSRLTSQQATRYPHGRRARIATNAGLGQIRWHPFPAWPPGWALTPLRQRRAGERRLIGDSEGYCDGIVNTICRQSLGGVLTARQQYCANRNQVDLRQVAACVFAAHDELRLSS